MAALAVDRALERLHETADEYGARLSGGERQPGLANHGPMAVHALATLGLDEGAIARWVDRYATHLDRPGPETAPVEGDWREVVRTEVPALLPGAVSSAGHGVIRTAHAVAMLEDADTHERRVELARALEYWKAWYMVLPVGAPVAALADLGSYRPTSDGWLISSRIKAMAEVPASITGAGVSSLDDLVDLGAGVLLANATDFGKVIALVHAVTTPAALRVLAPYVGEEAALAAAWPVVIALVAAYADDLREAEGAAVPDAVTRATDSGDEHAIKLAAATTNTAAVAAATRRLVK